MYREIIAQEQNLAGYHMSQRS
uniref:Uncharacterized protein n=1 Tax=Anguilla anguilla TaxID=7936 RepID=A0A0E9PWZ1_ANGAN